MNPAEARLLIIIPTYNERLNIGRLVDAVFAVAPPDAAMLIIDDGSPDGTAALVEEKQQEFPNRIHLIRREGKQGVATAFLGGFAWGIEHGYDLLLAMDADFSHDPQYIPIMLEKIQSNDMVIGSRNVPGGRIENRSIVRNLISKAASFYCRTILGFPIQDWTGGYNLFRAEVFQKIGLASIMCRGYSFQIEIKYKAAHAGCRIAETPIVFPDRKYGISKMSNAILFDAMRDVWIIRGMSWVCEFIKFALTGGLGTVTNIALFFILVDTLGFFEIPVAVFNYLVSGTQNYILNQKWSFKDRMGKTPLSWGRWIKFLTGSLAGLLVNITVMELVIHFWRLPVHSNTGEPYKFIAQAAGIAAGMIINFVILRVFVFKKPRMEVHHV
ncbi:MAG: glycosyltransferase family 2 protein [Spirochaetaceae bacterium]|jgi:dolichol-phosphate mannosyltransferase|nr:glycosyltransferase family 2 protein [Spirochaetaceae bacterium]